MNDLPPSGDEAKSQRLETIMPVVWGLLGILLAACFTLWLT